MDNLAAPYATSRVFLHQHPEGVGMTGCHKPESALAAAHTSAPGLRSDVRAAEGCLTPRSVCHPSPSPAPVALLEAVPPGHLCGPILPHPVTPVQHQPESRGAALRHAAGWVGGRPRRAGLDEAGFPGTSATIWNMCDSCVFSPGKPRSAGCALLINGNSLLETKFSNGQTHHVLVIHFQAPPGQEIERGRSPRYASAEVGPHAMADFLAIEFAQFISICRWLQLIHKDRSASLENAPFCTPWARERYRVAQRFRQY